MTTIPNAITLQINFNGRLESDREKFEKLATEIRTEHFIESLIKELDDEFASCRERHDKIIVSKGTEAKKYVDDDIFDEIRMKYHSFWALLSSHIPKLKNEDHSFNQSLSIPQCKKFDLKLPRLTLPTFDGEYEKWMEFHNSFNTAVHNNPNLEPIQKLQYLKDALTGPAFKLVRNLDLNNENYATARTLLLNRFQHSRRLVNAHFKVLFEYPKIQTENAENIKDFLDNITDCTVALNILNVKVEDYQLIYHMMKKLPQTTAAEYEKKLGASTTLPEFQSFISFLEERFRTLEMIEPLASNSKKSSKVFHLNKVKKNNNIRTKPKTDFTNKTNSKPKKLNCVLCKGEHALGRCERFAKLSQSERFSTVKTNNCCINCLDKSHRIDSCWSTGVCRVCKKKHHTLLHKYNVNPTDNNANSEGTSQHINSGNSTKLFHTQNSKQTTTLFGTAQLQAVNEHGMSIKVRALIDPCSEDNFILSSTVNTLNLTKYYEPSNIEVVGNTSSTNCSHRVNLILRSMDNRFYTKVSAAIVDSLTSDLPSVSMPYEAFGFLSELTIADPLFNKSGRIEILLGIGFYTRIRLEEFRRYGQDLVAENTLLGYIIRGTAGSQTKNSSKKVFMTQSTAIELNKNIQKFWELEELDRKCPMNPNDELCERIFTTTISRNADGRLSMQLPFKDNIDPCIGPSRFMAEKRFLSLEKKLANNQYLKEEYHKTIKNYIELKHLIKVPKGESTFNEYFLPHHAVCKESSTTTKVRVVFDASCKSLDGTSLNDHLLTGPKLQKDIREVLFNWRQYPISLTADIEKMYRMFNIDSKHHQYQKIVWRFEETQPIEDYALTTATFGTSCAPFLAIRCLHYISDQCKSSHSVASLAIRNEFYVDDFISGAFSVDEAIIKQSQIREVLDSYQLSLRKWSSNNLTVLSKIPSDLLDSSKEISFDETEFRKTLGIYWSQAQDSFFFSINSTDDSNSKFTKRQILSLIARLYDPLGWVSPCTMLAKQIMQRIWQTKAGWDDPIENQVLKQFQTFLAELHLLKDFKIPRWTNISDSKSTLTILGFCDASDKGYGAVIYLVDPISSKQENSLILLTSKTRVADLKYESTARLELNGAVLLSELLKWTVDLLKPRETKVVAFCDSKIVLAWLQSHPSRWKTYIANRTSQILEWMTPSQWSYVNTKLNPADFASRGLLPSELINNSLWINGPKLSELKIEKSPTLSEQQTNIFNEAAKKNSLVLHISSKLKSPYIQKISDHFKMQRFFSFIFKYLQPQCKRMVTYYENKLSILAERLKRISHSCDRSHIKFITITIQKLITRFSKSLTKFSDMILKFRNPENCIIRLVQKEIFHDEISLITQNKILPHKSTLKGLHPFIDNRGILRVGGRLQQSDLTFNQKHPVILPQKHLVTTNIVRMAHLITLHGTEPLTLAYLRNKYHIPRSSEKVKNVIHACIRCFKFYQKKQEQLMGSLPQNRVQFSNPFEHSGIDYAGPIVTKCYPGRCKKVQKSYIALFVCLCTKALHLEVASDLSSSAFLAAFRRFVGRRGRCHKLYSDNGTNFVGAEKILRDEIRKAELTWKTELEIDFQNLGTDWHFNPPSSPHFGGLWEAGVKSVKSHLKKTIGTSLLTFEELTTILVQIEGVLNSRPLCPMSNNVNDYNFLSPAHFLIGRPIVAPLEPTYDLDKETPGNRWRHLQVCFQRFAKLWRRDYLQNLQNRPKGQKEIINVKIGDLVLVTEDNVPPTIWPTAIIEEIHPGKDNVVRVVTIRTASGKILKRPVVKIRMLPCNSPLEN